MLAAGTAAQAGFSTMTLGLPVMAPALRDEFGLSLAQVGIVLGAEWVGLLLTLLPWGFAVDRFGERRSVAVGMGGCAACLAAAAYAPGFVSLVALVALAGGVGASVQSGSGRAVMRWFAASERGLALGVRQTAVPVGGIVGALVLPPVLAAGGVDAAFFLLAGLCALGAVAAGLVLRDRPVEESVVAGAPWTLRDRRLWIVSWASGLYLFAQIAVLGFLVLFLHDERGWSTGAAAAVLVGVNVLGGTLRIAGGRWSDVLGSRLRPLRWAGVAIVVTLGAAAALLSAPIAPLVAVFVVAGGLSMAWNGLAFTCAAELAGAGRSGAAIGFQQTVLSAIGTVVPPVFAAVVATTSWRVAFALAAAVPLVGWWWLGRVTEPPAAKWPVRVANQGKGSGGTGRFPHRPTCR